MGKEDLYNICLSYRHDFGIMPKEERDMLMVECKEWIDAINKNKPKKEFNNRLFRKRKVIIKAYTLINLILSFIITFSCLIVFDRDTILLNNSANTSIFLLVISMFLNFYFYVEIDNLTPYKYKENINYNIEDKLFYIENNKIKYGFIKRIKLDKKSISILLYNSDKYYEPKGFFFKTKKDLIKYLENLK